MPSMPKDYRDNWYKTNKDKHLKYCSEKIECECGKKISRSSVSRHKLSGGHISKIEKFKSDKTEMTDNILKEILRIQETMKYIEKK